MKWRGLQILLFAVLTSPGPALSGEPAIRIDAQATPRGSEAGPSSCGERLMNAETQYDGYAWQYGGVVPPDYGSWAECYEGAYEVCAAVFNLTQLGNQQGQTMDVYVWDDGGGIPGNVVCFRANIDPGPIAPYPDQSTHAVPLEGCCVEGSWWIGCWPNWPGQQAGWFIANDIYGSGTCAKTKIAPGIGFPTGWQNVSIVWGPTPAMWIGADVRPCLPTPAHGASWGRIKSLY